MVLDINSSISAAEAALVFSGLAIWLKAYPDTKLEFVAGHLASLGWTGEAPVPTLELARVFFCPALYHHFFFGIELDGVAAFSMEDAKEAVLPAAEWEICNGSGYADVDSDIAGGCFVTEAPSCRAARREQRSLIAVLAVF